MFEEIYHEYLLHRNDENTEERYVGNEGWYHASGAGLCSRKLYYESVEKIPTKTKTFEEMEGKERAGQRKMGLGTIIHEDIQNALIYYNNIYYNTHSKEKEKKELLTYKKKKFEDLKFKVEGEVTLPSLNVRGFYDILLFDSSVSKNEPYVKLYDIKTLGAWQWSKRFPQPGKGFPPKPGGHYYLQLGTYGLAIKEKYGNLDHLGLIFYNINTQIMRETVVPHSYVDEARRYWYSINEEHAKGLPKFREGTSPVHEWVCAYCQFKEHCNPPTYRRETWQS